MGIGALYAILFLAVIIVIVVQPLLHRKKLTQNATLTTEGRVTGNEDIGLGDSSVWVEVVEYEVDGWYYKLKDKVRGKDTGGSTVVVHYVPGHPKKAWAEWIPSPGDAETDPASNETDERLR